MSTLLHPCMRRSMPSRSSCAKCSRTAARIHSIASAYRQPLPLPLPQPQLPGALAALAVLPLPLLSPVLPAAMHIAPLPRSCMRTVQERDAAPAQSASVLGRRRPLRVLDLPGVRPYAQVWEWQQRIVREKVDAERKVQEEGRGREQQQAPLTYRPPATACASAPAPPTSSAASLPAGLSDVLLLVEHAPVYTLGRNASLEHLRFPPDVRVRVVERGEVSARSTAASAPGTDAPTEEPAHFELLRVERGGEVTYHGPGQLVMYPLLALNPAPKPCACSAHAHSTGCSAPSPFRADLHWFLRSLESVVIRLLRLYGIEGERMEGASGVWVRMEEESPGTQAAVAFSSDPASVSPAVSAASVAPVSPPAPLPPRRLHKIAALGLSCTRWVSMHGVALNVASACLPPFEHIVPCGLGGDARFAGVTSIEQVMQQRRKRAGTHVAREHRRGGMEAGEADVDSGALVDVSTVRRQWIECFEAEFQVQAETIQHDAPM